MTPPRWLLALIAFAFVLEVCWGDSPTGYTCECVASLNGETTGRMDLEVAVLEDIAMRPSDGLAGIPQGPLPVAAREAVGMCLAANPGRDCACTCVR